MWSLLGGVFLGWSLGRNDAANVIGSAVATRMLKVRTAVLVAAIFALLGAVLEGGPGIRTYGALTAMTLADAVTTSIGAALAVTLLNLLGLPTSTSHAAVGAILGIGLLHGQTQFGGFAKVALCWVCTPLSGAAVGALLYLGIGWLYNRLRLNLFQADAALRIGLTVAGAYSAYALGANNVANVTGIFVGTGQLDVPLAALIGGASIAIGVLTCNRHVMTTVGRGLVRLNPYSALVVLLAQAVTIHVFTNIGVPVSSTHAVIGAVLGVGMVRGSNTVHTRMLVHIVGGWFVTPVLGCALTLLVHFLTHLRYIA